jgi:hypothetical protein
VLARLAISKNELLLAAFALVQFVPLVPTRHKMLQDLTQLFPRILQPGATMAKLEVEHRANNGSYGSLLFFAQRLQL